MVRIVTDASRNLEGGPECDCGHALSLHRLQPAGCSAVDEHGHPCACSELRLAEDVPVSVRVQLIRDQLDIARAILSEAEKRHLPPEDQFAISQLAAVLVELTDAVRNLLSE
jgi:hypothetical protein